MVLGERLPKGLEDTGDVSDDCLNHLWFGEPEAVGEVFVLLQEIGDQLVFVGREARCA